MKKKNRISEISGTSSIIPKHTFGSFKRKGKKGAEKMFEEIMVKNFQNLMENINPHIQEISSKINLKRSSPRHIIKLKAKDDNLESSKRTDKSNSRTLDKINMVLK